MVIDAIKTYLHLVLKSALGIAKYVCKTIRFTIAYIVLVILLVFGISTKTIIVCFLIPLLVWITTSIVGIYLNNKGIGERFPIPQERFTEKLPDGEVRLRNDRLQELILYMKDLEDWFENNGYTK